MMIRSLVLQNFRCYSNRVLPFATHTVMVVGANGIGKTSIVEALALLAHGSSFRAMNIEDMIFYEQELARIKAIVESNQLTGDTQQAVGDHESAEDKVTLEMLLTRGFVQGKKTRKSLFMVNDIKRRKQDFCANFYAVVFRPEDLRLIEGSPERRRSFINTALSVVDRQYAQALKIYEQTLKRRNRLLFEIKEGRFKPSVLSYWNQSLLKNGQILQEKRRQFFEFLSTVSFPLVFTIEYQPSIISLQRLTDYSAKELLVGHTLIGPHKDDFDLKLADLGQRSLARFGSRGQQRMGVLWLKIGELAYLQANIKEKPVLLLDDILSELDELSKEKVLSLLGKRQTIITTTDEQLIDLVKTIDPNTSILRLQR